MRIRSLIPLLLALPLAASASFALPQVLAPVAVESVADANLDGIGDSFNGPTFDGLIRRTAPVEDRAIQEFDVSAFSSVSGATLAGTVFVNNAFDVGTRTFDFLLYEGNGTVELADFQVAATFVGSDSYSPPTDTSFTYSFDVTGVVQSLLAGGASHIGLKVVPTSNPNFPNILDDSTSTLTLVAGGGGIGTSYCTSTPNSSGAAALITASGSASVQANNLTLTAQPVPIGQPGIFYYGENELQAPFGNGFRCVGGAVFRLPPNQAPSSVLTDTLDNQNLPANGNFFPGVTFKFQSWYRDPVAGGAGFDLSNGLSITFTP